MLDLGACMNVQSKVEKYYLHNVKQQYDLAYSVKKTWREVDKKKLTKIMEQYIKVLDIIIQDHGKNDLLDSNQGLKGAPEETVETDSPGDESNEEQ